MCVILHSTVDAKVSFRKVRNTVEYPNNVDFVSTSRISAMRE